MSVMLSLQQANIVLQEQILKGKQMKHAVSQCFADKFSINILRLARYVIKQHLTPEYVDNDMFPSKRNCCCN